MSKYLLVVLLLALPVMADEVEPKTNINWEQWDGIIDSVITRILRVPITPKPDAIPVVTDCVSSSSLTSEELEWLIDSILSGYGITDISRISNLLEGRIIAIKGNGKIDKLTPSTYIKYAGSATIINADSATIKYAGSATIGSGFVDYHEPKPDFLKMKINLKIDTIGWNSYKSIYSKREPSYGYPVFDSSWYHDPILKYTYDTTYYLPPDVLFLIEHYYCDSTFKAEWMERWMLSNTERGE